MQKNILTKNKFDMIPNFKEFNQINESRNPNPADADDFITEVLKLGSKNNLFDSFMKKKGLNPNELSTFVEMVNTELKKWT